MRPKRIRCYCCRRLMAFEPYKRGDAIRRPAPNAGHCLDCNPQRESRHVVRLSSDHNPWCWARGCVPGNAIDKLASLARGMT